MAVLPQFGGLSEAQMLALMRDSGALLSATGKNGYQQYNNCAAAVVSRAQSELTCNGGSGVVLPSRKRGREAGLEQYYVPSSALLPVPGMLLSPPDMGMATQSTHLALTSTNGRGRPTAAVVDQSSAADALVSELCRHGAEVDALVRAECERLRAGVEQARKRQRQALARAVAGAVERRMREAESELDAARRRAVELEERVRQAAAESQAWRGLARSHEAVAAGIRATLDHVLLRGAAPVEGCGESDHAPCDDAQSSCFEALIAAAPDTAATSPAGNKWACKACGEREASVLLLPCRHLCLCKACEPRLDACPVCATAKNASIHIAVN